MMRRVNPRVAVVGGLILAAFCAGFVVAQSEKVGGPDPDIGLTEAQQQAAHRANSEAFWADYEKWIAEQNATSIDWRKLPAYDLLATYAGPSLTLGDAVARADRWVSGKVVDTTFLPTGNTSVELQVSEGSADQPGSVLAVEFPGGLFPADDWAPTIGLAEAAPLVFAGEDVVLLLDADPATGLLMPQMWTGVYRVHRDGRVAAVPANPFARTIERGTAKGLERLLSETFEQLEVASPRG